MITMSLEGDWGKVERGENGWFCDNRCRYTTLFLYCKFRKRLIALAPFSVYFFCILIYGLVMYKTDSASYFWYSILCGSYIVSFTCCVGFLTVHWDNKIALPVFLYILTTNRKRSNISHAGFQKAVQKPETAASTDMTDNSTMFFVNLDNFLILIVGIHPGIFLKRLIKNVLFISSVETNVVCHDGV